MQKDAMKTIGTWLLLISISWLFNGVVRGEAAAPGNTTGSLKENKLDYRSDDQFTMSLMHLASEKITSGNEADLKYLLRYLDQINRQQLSLAQYQQVLFLQAESNFLLNEFDTAYQRYMELELLIRDKSDPTLEYVERRLKASRKKVRAAKFTSTFTKQLKPVENEYGKFIYFALFFALLALILAGKSFAIWNKKKYDKFKGSGDRWQAPIETKLIELPKMVWHDGRISEKTMAHYKENESSGSSPEHYDESTAAARLLAEGHEMIKRVNQLAPYPVAFLSKVPLLNKLSPFWQYTVTGFILIAFKALLNIYFIDGYNLAQHSVGLFLLAAFIISSLTCLRIMARATINALDEIVSMLEIPGKTDTGKIPASVLQIEKNMNFLFRSPWQFFIVILIFSAILISFWGNPDSGFPGVSPEIWTTLFFALIILLIACPIIWLLIGSVYVLNDISNMEDLAINPLSPLKTMGLEKWTSVIGTYGLASSIVLSFGCSLPVITNAINKGTTGGWFWFIMILPLLFFYWIYPYLKISNMVKQQKTDRMQLLKTKILNIFNDWVKFEENQLEAMRERRDSQPEDKCCELFDFRTQMADKLKLYLEPMNMYYSMFQKIDESPHSYINFGSTLELGKALGIPSLFAMLSALLF